MTIRTGPYLPEAGDAIIEIRASRLREMAAERQSLQDRHDAALTICDQWETYATQYPNVPPAQFAQAIRRALGGAS